MTPIKAIKKIEANPIKIAVMLIEETDPAKMVSTLDDYCYTRQIPLSEGWGASISHPNSSIIRDKLAEGEKFPTIEVKFQASTKEKVQILKSLNFYKQGNTYERKSVGYITLRSLAKHGSPIFQRHSKPKD